MKFKILIAAIVIINTLGCNKSFIELDPHDFLSSGNFYNTKNDFEQALLGVYGNLQNYYNGSPFVLGDLPSDIAVKEFNNGDRGAPQQYEEVDEFRVTSVNGITGSVWSSYTGIAQANGLLEKLASQDFLSDSELSQFEGELKFIRAIFYFELVKAYGDVPLVLKSVSVDESLNLRRKPKAEIYNSIVDDLTQAITKLPVEYSTENLGRATRGAAQALLGRVYLFMGELSSALTQFRTVINSGNYDLLANYADVFDPSNENHKETIFDIQYISGGVGEGSQFPYRLAPLNSNSVLTFNQGASPVNAVMVPSNEFIGEIEPSDLRKDVLFKENWVDDSGNVVKVPWITKYHNPGPADGSDSDTNWPFLRYAEVILSVAEILNENGYIPDGEAFDLLNKIRVRAGLIPLTATDLKNQEEFRQALAQERKVELAFEGHRWWDLIRTGKAISRMTEHGIVELANPTTERDQNRFPLSIDAYQITVNDLLWPIPQGEINKVPGVLTQNPGY